MFNLRARINYFKDWLEIVYDLDKCRNYRMKYRDGHFYVYKRKKNLIPDFMYTTFMTFKPQWVWEEVASSEKFSR